jgi:glycosyltransferase involved in cell wall biosynthesis
MRHEFGRKDIVLLHNVPEAIDVPTAGYRVSSVVLHGAHMAIRQLRGLSVVVFSKKVGELLVSSYGITPVLTHPLPVARPPSRPRMRNGVPRLLTIGYLAPYKGYQLLLDALKRLNLPVETLFVGDEHRILRRNPEYQQFVSGLRRRAAAETVRLHPKVPDGELPALMSSIDLGVLPYSAAQGASGAASLLASFGVPILATDLPAFRELADLGSGIVLSPPDPEEFARGIERILRDPSLGENLRGMQRQYAERYSWDRFLERLDGVLGKEN